MNAPARHDEHYDVVERRWRQQFIADLPDTASFAAELSDEIALALINAYWDQHAPGYRARTGIDAADLRRWGLREYPGGHNTGLLLTNFGTDVRRHLLAAEAMR